MDVRRCVECWVEEREKGVEGCMEAAVGGAGV